MKNAAKKKCTISSFGILPDGRKVELYTLVNAKGMKVSICTYGAAVVSIIVPDKQGESGDVALGFDCVEGYLQKDNPFFGATIGRFGNRIAKGKFVLNDKEYTLPINNGVNHLHGGESGFDKVLWRRSIENFSVDDCDVTLCYTSPNGEQGYPGTMELKVRFVLSDDNALHFYYFAVSDMDTVVNLTNHTYLNLDGSLTIENHLLKLHSSYFTPVDSTQIPTGEIRSVKGTPFDFVTAQKIGHQIDTPNNDQISYGGGYDHNFVVSTDTMLKPVASAYSEASGRLLEVLSTEPGVQFYSGNNLDGTLRGKDGRIYRKRSGFCLETQHYPDSPNQPVFPSTVLRAGVMFESTTIYRFSVADKFC